MKYIIRVETDYYTHISLSFLKMKIPLKIDMKIGFSKLLMSKKKHNLQKELFYLRSNNSIKCIFKGI